MFGVFAAYNLASVIFLSFLSVLAHSCTWTRASTVHFSQRIPLRTALAWSGPIVCRRKVAMDTRCTHWHLPCIDPSHYALTLGWW